MSRLSTTAPVGVIIYRYMYLFFGPETLFLRKFSAVMGFPSKSIIISRRGASQDPICSVDVIFFVSGVITMFYSPLIDQEEMKALR